MNILVSIWLFLTGLFTPVAPPTPQPTPDMCYDSDYPKLWAKVDSLQNQGMTRSAREVVESIYAQAKKEKNAPQHVKSVLYLLRYNQQVEENTDSLNMVRVKEEVKTADFPAKAIFQSIQAGMYEQYYNQNRWRIMNRSSTTNFNIEDYQTWAAKDFAEASQELYWASVAKAADLQKIAIGDYADILSRNNPSESELRRPTLYDLLAHRALDHFSNTEYGLSSPAYAFTISESDAFSPLKTFTELSFPEKDTLNRDLQAAKLFQQILKFHTADAKPEARVDADLKRLNWSLNHAKGENKKKLYLNQLENMADTYKGKPVSAQILSEVAQVYYERGNESSDSERTYPDAYKKAHQICSEVVKNFPNEYGTAQCASIKNSIENKELYFTAEDVQVPSQSFRGKVTYRNLNKVWCRIIPFSYKDQEKFNSEYEQNKKHEILTKVSPVNSWNVSLPEHTDFYNHSTEISLKGLPVGQYAILISDNEQFAYQNHAIAYTFVEVSNLAFFTVDEGPNTTGYHFRNRATGEPNADVLIKEFKYEYNKGYKPTGNTWKTDKEGYATITKTKPTRYSYESLHYEYSKGNDMLRGGSFYAYFRDEQEEDQRPFINIFTDRKIYRPGQTVYFKGIALRRKDGEIEILKNKTYEVVFRDANYQEIAKQKLTTNDYGTFSGTFTAPTAGLMGSMQLITDYGGTEFSVEEYKRPKFEVKMDELKGSYSLGETVKVTGIAEGYSGVVVDNASVTYRVVREARYPYWGYYCWWKPAPSAPSMEITNGTIKTDEDGKFSLEFQALADPTLSEADKPEFTYTVYATVADITGETHEAQTSIRLGYIALYADLNIKTEIAKDAPDTAAFITQNLNGVFEAAKGKISIHRLVSPTNWQRRRRWEQVDSYLMPEAEYRKLFPNDVYKNEDEPKNWAKGEAVYDKAFDTGTSPKLPLDFLKTANAGIYIAEMLVKDKNDKEIKVVKYFTLNDKKANVPAIPTLFALRTSHTSLEPGNTLKVFLETSEKSLWVSYYLQRENKTLEKRLIKITRGTTTLQIPVKEEWRGGFTITAAAVVKNEASADRKIIDVPYSNKVLKLEWMTFRNKLLPGAKEEWKLKISGPKGEAVAAEMLAGMYDASLDAFRSNAFGLNPYGPKYHSLYYSTIDGWQTRGSSLLSDDWNPYTYAGIDFAYDELNLFGFYFGDYYGGRVMYKSRSNMMAGAVAPAPMMADKMTEAAAEEIVMEADKKESARPQKVATGDIPAEYGDDGVTDTISDLKPQPSPKSPPPSIRRNLQETAFFFPHLETNAQGEVILNFTMPEALTKWKFIGLAHTQDMKIGTLGGETVTQKELMIQPNLPRFLRVGDKMKLTAKVSNLTDTRKNTIIELHLFDALTGKEIGDNFTLYNWQQKLDVEGKSNSLAEWEITVPENVQAVTCRMTVEAEGFSDGEESALPVVLNKMLVTESLPLPIRGNETRIFSFTKLLENKSSTLQSQKFTLEFTSNPAWYAVQALPYLMEYPHECTEQVFSRYYANSLATHIANSSPKVKQVFDQWKAQAKSDNGGKQALLSNLETNQELKSALLEETPWVLNAQDETERKKRVGLLFDLNKMADEMERAEKKMADRQHSDGSFAWFPGMDGSRYITQLLVTGIGHLDKLGVKMSNKTQNMVENALPYLDRQIDKDYNDLKRYKVNLEDNHLGYDHIQYLYMRTFFPSQKQTLGTETAYNYYYGQAKKYWNSQSNYMKGMLALIFHRKGDKDLAQTVIKSLKENAVFNAEMGMYWKYDQGWYWYQAPIETQSLLIEAFQEVTNDTKSVEEMKVWLLKNKQTNDWETTRATVEACNALLLTGTNLLESNSLVEVSLGNMKIDPATRPDTKVEAGTGYYKTAWSGKEITPEFGKITVKKSDAGVAWGAAYWQYFENLDKITFAKTPLAIDKKLFVERNTPSGPVIEPLNSGAKLKQGDKVKVRIEIRVDREMEYVHLKDMRASGFEPISVFSQYKYQNGLGYYESTKDLATHFFFDYLPKGVHVFEYELRATHKGDFSNGITTMQSMYAPEFTSHSEGVRVVIE